ncbi:MAG: hypothetical protein HQ514_03215 [Rhodospirillales bacterium]|nr:hypothetical protein [Rhodospirillales bacterium]
MTMVEALTQRRIRKQIAKTAYQAHTKAARRGDFAICDLKTPKAILFVDTKTQIEKRNPNTTLIQALRKGWREIWELRICQRKVSVPANIRLVGSKMIYTPNVDTDDVIIGSRVQSNTGAVSAKSPCEGLRLKHGTAGNFQPFFGCAEKTEQMRNADAKFLKLISKLNPDRKASARKMIELGWKYFKKRDYDTAMRRFNQALLLNPDSPDILHAYAVLLIQRDKNYIGAEALFKRAISVSVRKVIESYE